MELLPRGGAPSENSSRRSIRKLNHDDDAAVYFEDDEDRDDDDDARKPIKNVLLSLAVSPTSGMSLNPPLVFGTNAPSWGNFRVVLVACRCVPIRSWL